MPATLVTRSCTWPATITVTVAVTQLPGFSTSQIVYGKVYVPVGIAVPMRMVPSGFIFRPGCDGTPGTRVTSPGRIGRPPSVCFSSTLGVVPPPSPDSGSVPSPTGSNAGAVTVTVTLASAQLPGCSTSQMR